MEYVNVEETEEIEAFTPKIVTPSDRIRELEQENEALKGTTKKNMGLMEIFQNPDGIMRSLEINEAQARNLRSTIATGVYFASHRFLGKLVGDVVAGAIGGIGGALLARKLIR